MTQFPSFHKSVSTLNEALGVAKDNELNQFKVAYKDQVKINTTAVKSALERRHIFIHLQLYLSHDRHKDKLILKVMVAVAWHRESKTRGTF